MIIITLFIKENTDADTLGQLLIDCVKMLRQDESELVQLKIESASIAWPAPMLCEWFTHQGFCNVVSEKI